MHPAPRFEVVKPEPDIAGIFWDGVLGGSNRFDTSNPLHRHHHHHVVVLLFFFVLASLYSSSLLYLSLLS